MECNISELVKLGHARAADLKAECGAVDVRSAAQLISDLATQLDVQLRVAAESQRYGRQLEITIENLEAKCLKLAAENAESEKRMQQLIQVINNADNDYCMCGDAMKNHAHGGCGHPTGMFDYHYNQWLESGNKTPATDAFLAEVRAQGVEMAISELFEASNIEAFSVKQLLISFAAQLRKGEAE